ncbi:hypothetical protein [Nonomuraea dietziae]|uniref:hypothetical protein n=1 Tax=Nonomuraea dietziae TaxID=65515 RepID=UPI0033C7F3BA
MIPASGMKVDKRYMSGATSATVVSILLLPSERFSSFIVSQQVKMPFVGEYRKISHESEPLRHSTRHTLATAL